MTTATAERTRQGPGAKVTVASAGGPLTGAGILAKLALRRDRIMLPAWVYVVVIGVASSAYTFTHLYKTAVVAGSRWSRRGRATRRCCSSTAG